MTRYVNVKVNISDGQKEKIKKAAQSDTAVSIRLSHEDDDKGLRERKRTNNKIKKGSVSSQYESGRRILTRIIRCNGSSCTFLLKTALPALATGALSGLASTGVSKALRSSLHSGAWLYIKKGDYSAKVMKAGQGLYLSPWKKGNSVNASGLYMKTGKGTYSSGEGLILGPDSPFKNIPILGLIL